MEALFLKILNMSITAGWIVLVVVLLRLVFKKAPKWISCVLWAVVALRLVCPFTVESVLSLIPSAETIPPDIVYQQEPAIYSGIGLLNSVVNPVLSESSVSNPGESVNPLQIVSFAASWLWIVGMAAMVLYTLISYLRLRRKVREAAPLKDNIWVCDHIFTPFILGIFRPRIYLPSNMSETDMEYVIAHEKAHLKRRDHWWKPLGFALLTVYWFNPLMWVAYILLCRDIEIACDEKVIGKMDADGKISYSEALINCSVPRRTIAACPLAFGEVGVKSRIKSVLSYRRPAFWIIIVAIAACIVLAVCFLTNPHDRISRQKSGADIDGVTIKITDVEEGTEPALHIEWSNNSEETIKFGDSYRVYKEVDGQWKYKGESNSLLWAYMLQPDNTTSIETSFAARYFLESGKYRLESDITGENEKTLNRKVWLEFYLSEDFIEPPEIISWQRSGTDVMGVSLEVVAFDTQSENPDITVKWTDKSGKDYGASQEYYIYREVDGEWRSCGNGYWNMIDFVLYDDVWLWSYSLSNFDMSQPGKYRFESVLGKDKEVWVEFYLKEGMQDISKTGGADEPEEVELSSAYTYKESPDPLEPIVALNQEDGTCHFRYSGFSSYYFEGKYELSGRKLTLNGGDLTYTFYVEDNTLIFNAAESSKIPEYKYSGDATETQCPVPDGAVFVAK